ncbi:hypothetical protein Lalb_Chr05g0227161 [Lupinus albus]|uniref:Uncharacterized protein n=1 Tax=Lupinus albus TaxID=3870 RepID=A0A6A4QM42_LUPAL|nr:hypothetical protein Lalb_Chr05g0227161 [Lupinus albus]
MVAISIRWLSKNGFFTTTFVLNSLITIYFNCKCIVDSYVVLEEAEAVAMCDHISYNAMIDMTSFHRIHSSLNKLYGKNVNIEFILHFPGKVTCFHDGCQEFH